MHILRTPDSRFEDLPDFPYPPHYTEVAAEGGSDQKLRIHHIDSGPHSGETVLCMHGQPTWSYLYRHMIPLLNDRGLRVIAPDLPGFGRSDKPGAREDYSYNRQVEWMSAWLEHNDLRDLTLVGQDWGGLIGLRLVAAHPDRFARVVAANTALPLPPDLPEDRVRAVRDFRENAPTPTMAEMAQAISGQLDLPREQSFAYWQKWTWESPDFPVGAMIAGTLHGRTLTAPEIEAYDAPFPDASYKMGPRAMPSQVPTLPGDPSTAAQLEAWKTLSQWTRPFLCAFTDNDPVTAGAEQIFQQRVPGARGQAHVQIEGGGHFLQEGRAERLSEVVADFIAANPATALAGAD